MNEKNVDILRYGHFLVSETLVPHCLDKKSHCAVKKNASYLGERSR